MARTFLYVVVALLLVGTGGLLAFPTKLAGASVGPIGQNDAGSGQDAGDAPENALLLANLARRWNANLTPPGTDSDWYRLADGGAFCAQAEISTSAAGQVTLASDAARAAAVSRDVVPGQPLPLALAGPAGGAPYLGLEPVARLLMSDGSSTPSPGRYAFALVARTHADLDPEADGETPEAGPTPATSVDLPDGCLAGRLSSARGDVVDRYHFDVSTARLAGLSFVVSAGDAAQLRVLAPDGATRAVLRSGDAIDLWASESGRWSAVVEPVATAAGSGLPLLALLAGPGAGTDLESSYLLGTTLGPGDREPCRPSCLG